jgi:hypothetical protein
VKQKSSTNYLPNNIADSSHQRNQFTGNKRVKNCILTSCLYLSCISFHESSRSASNLSERLKRIPEQSLPTSLETMSLSQPIKNYDKVIKIRGMEIEVFTSKNCSSEYEPIPRNKSPWLRNYMVVLLSVVVLGHNM